jgi:uncharacterized protein YodC (DUF2158 family)
MIIEKSVWQGSAPSNVLDYLIQPKQLPGQEARFDLSAGSSAQNYARCNPGSTHGLASQSVLGAYHSLQVRLTCRPGHFYLVTFINIRIQICIQRKKDMLMNAVAQMVYSKRACGIYECRWWRRGLPQTTSQYEAVSLSPTPSTHLNKA